MTVCEECQRFENCHELLIVGKDLTYCYLHMTEHELAVLDTFDSPAYFDGLLPDDDMVIPPGMIPPNPEEHDALPSQAHPSYPFGDPTHPKHPASRPRLLHDSSSRILFEDMGFTPPTVELSLRWKDLALDQLLPLDESKEVAIMAMAARKMASGVSNNPPQQNPGVPPGAPSIDESEEGDNESNDEDEDEDSDENGDDTDG